VTPIASPDLAVRLRDFFGALPVGLDADDAAREVEDELAFWGDRADIDPFVLAHDVLRARARVAPLVEAVALVRFGGVDPAAAAALVRAPVEDVSAAVASTPPPTQRTAPDHDHPRVIILSDDSDRRTVALAPLPATPSPWRWVGLAVIVLTLGFLAVRALARSGVDAAAPLPVAIREARLTANVSRSGVPGPDATSFRPGQSIHLWLDVEHGATGPAVLAASWWTGDVRTFDHRLALRPDLERIDLTLPRGVASTPGDYRVEVRACPETMSHADCDASSTVVVATFAITAGR